MRNPLFAFTMKIAPLSRDFAGTFPQPIAQKRKNIRKVEQNLLPIILITPADFLYKKNILRG